MTKYTELVKALRWCAENFGCPIECPRYSPADEGVRACVSRLEKDAADAIEALQAEVERLKDCNEELREKQTYIDHYGDKWMTSAKDVPTAAYKHGYADGRDEAEAQLPKRGKWIGVNPMVDTVQCSICGGQLFSAELETPYCPYCGAKMREVQE